jgi:hypothetical protein
MDKANVGRWDQNKLNYGNKTVIAPLPPQNLGMFAKKINEMKVCLVMKDPVNHSRLGMQMHPFVKNEGYQRR